MRALGTFSFQSNEGKNMQRNIALKTGALVTIGFLALLYTDSRKELVQLKQELVPLKEAVSSLGRRQKEVGDYLKAEKPAISRDDGIEPGENDGDSPFDEDVLYDDEEEGEKARPQTPAAVKEFIRERYDQRFAAEPVDRQWSHRAANGIEEVAAERGEGESIDSLDCRSSLCRIEASFSSIETYNRFFDAVNDMASEGLGDGMISPDVNVLEDGTVKAVTYLVREGRMRELMEYTRY